MTYSTILSIPKRKNGYVAIKTDMAKAYDRLEWKFIKATMLSMGFPIHIVSIIMKCVTSVSYSILINGRPSTRFKPQRGIRQGDPLSPYLFILYANVFSALISKAQLDNQIHGVKIAPGALEISHLSFADDSLILCKANKSEASTIHLIISTYQEASGQLVNLDKSELLFSKYVNQQAKTEVMSCLPMQVVTVFSKYLGMPTYIGRSKNRFLTTYKKGFGKN